MFTRTLLITTAASILVMGVTPAVAMDINKVQMGIKVAKGSACPRKATVHLWAHTDGVGPVKFKVENTSGNYSGIKVAPAVKGAADNYLATHVYEFNIAADVNTKYRAHVIGSNKKSPWVPLVATCGPQVRDKTTTTSSGAKPPAKKASDVNKKKTTTTSGGAKPPAKKAGSSTPATKPAGGSNSKPASGSSTKPLNKVCKGTRIKVNRVDAITKKGGIATAWAAWSTTVGAKYGLVWRKVKLAKGPTQSCTRTGIVYQCVVSAYPCREN